MAHTLFDETVANIIRVEILREPGYPSAKLSIRNDVDIDAELRSRGKRLRVGTADVADSADAMFRLMKEELEKLGITSDNEKRFNLPKIPRGERKFSATADVNVEGKNDDELRIIFADALNATIGRMGAARFREIVGYWSDRRAGNAADTIGL